MVSEFDLSHRNGKPRAIAENRENVVSSFNHKNGNGVILIGLMNIKIYSERII